MNNTNTYSYLTRTIMIFFTGMTVFFAALNLSYAEEATVTQPPIIPTGSMDSGKLYLPHDNGENPMAFQDQFLPQIATTIISITAALSLLFMIIAGIMFLVTFGGPEMASTAKRAASFAMIGLVISSLSYAIVRIISTINP